jgi:micrococcal nuclease
VATYRATVVHVSDGDTITVDVGNRVERVRILGADTPEVVDPRKPVQCYGPEASAHTKARLPPGTEVTLETDAEPRDKYGRLLAYVYVAGARYDDELLRLGFARLLVIPPNGVHARAMLQAELAARAVRRGLWGSCGR